MNVDIVFREFNLCVRSVADARATTRGVNGSFKLLSFMVLWLSGRHECQHQPDGGVLLMLAYTADNFSVCCSADVNPKNRFSTFENRNSVFDTGIRF